MALRLDRVTFGYEVAAGASSQVLTDVSVVVDRARVLLIIGCTGSGKSTLLRMAAGILRPSAGTVEADGMPVRPGVPGPKGVVGLVFQRPESQLFAESVIDDVAFGPRNLGVSATEATQRAVAALEAVGLDPAMFGSRSPFGLSGGEARRVALAGILAMEPAYLLLDEPTAGLDRTGREAVIRTIERAGTEAGVVVVTHDPEEFLGVADDMLVLSEGRVAYVGPIEDGLADPALFESAGLVVPDIPRMLHSAITRGRGASSRSEHPRADQQRPSGGRIEGSVSFAASPEDAADVVFAAWRGR